jgi:hypothetical protein
MTTKWIDAQENDNADALAAAFWERHRDELTSGAFWADRIKTHYGEPAERLRVAIENLPLPGAFREAAVAARAFIRQQRKQNGDDTDWLRLLYWLAAVESFSIPYSEVLQEPGFNVMQSIPGEVVRALRFTYRELGHKQLRLLNRTDVNWLEDKWGTPASHTTLHDLHRSVWEEYEERLRARRDTERTKLIEELVDLADGRSSDG